MAKKKEVPWSTVAFVAIAGWAATRFGLMAKVFAGEIPTALGMNAYREYPPLSEVGAMGQAEWQKKYGGSQLDYEDWLRGQ